MKNNRSSQSTAHRSAFFGALSLITVGSIALGAVLAGPAAIGPAVLVGGALLWIAVLVQEFRPVHGFAYRAPRQAPQVQKYAAVLPQRASRYRAPARRPRLAKVVG